MTPPKTRAKSNAAAADDRQEGERGALLGTIGGVSRDGRRRIAIVGMTRSGKSVLHQGLGKASRSSAPSQPRTSAAERPVTLGSEPFLLIDTPGISSLDGSSDEERSTQRLLRDDPPDLIIQCVDAGRLSRSLSLTAQLAALDVPMVMCLNMYDEAMDDGVLIDAPALSRALGIPVTPACALDGRGLRSLESSLTLARVPVALELHAGHDRRPARSPAGVGATVGRGHPITSLHPCRRPGLCNLQRDRHRRWAEAIAAQVVRRTGLEPKQRLMSRIGDWVLRPVGAFVFLASTLTAIYWLVAKLGAGILGGAMDRWFATPLCGLIARHVQSGPLRQALVGDFGLISLGLLNGLCTVLPILTLFYLAYGGLEEMGYFPYLAAQLDRLMRWVGLTGKAVFPMALGFGCNSVATMAASRLETARQRFIAAFLIALGVPCAVQLGVLISILSTVPLWAIACVLAALLTTQLLAGRLLATFLPAQQRGEFLVDIPRLRWPSLRRLLGRTLRQMLAFLREAIPLFVASAAVLQGLQLVGLLDRIRRGLAPIVVVALGLPEKFADTLLATLARREVGAVMMKEMVDRGALSTTQIVVALVVMTLFVPCLNNTLILARTMGWLRAAAVVVVVVVVAIGTGAVIHALLT